MRPVPTTVFVTFLALALSLLPRDTPASARPTVPLVLSHATLYDGRGGPPILNADVVIHDGRVRCAGPAGACRLTKRGRVIDLTGQFITPGLIDAHVHLVRTGWIDTGPDRDVGVGVKTYNYEQIQRSIRTNPGRWHRAWLCSGATGLLDAGGFAWTIDHARAVEHDPNRAHVTAAGPLLRLYWTGGRTAMGEQAYLPGRTDEEAVASLRWLKKRGSQVIKLHYPDPPADQAAELAARAKLVGRETDRLGMQLMTHAFELHNAKIALAAGTDILAHTVNDKLLDDEFMRLLLEKRPVVVSTLLAHWNRAQSRAAVTFAKAPGIDDPNHCVDPPTKAKLRDLAVLRDDAPAEWRSIDHASSVLHRAGQTLAIKRENLRRMHRAGVTIAAGTDAGGPLTFHGPAITLELRAIEAAGIPPAEVLVMATRNGARAMMRNDIGTIEAGMIADLVVLREDPGASTKAFRTVSMVMRAGVLRPVSFFQS